jgi:hypothetical protein
MQNVEEIEELAILSKFLVAASDDFRIGPSHVSMYLALFTFYLESGRQKKFAIKRAMVMKRAKILGLATYHKCLKDLVDASLIQYFPSYSSHKSTYVAI